MKKINDFIQNLSLLYKIAASQIFLLLLVSVIISIFTGYYTYNVLQKKEQDGLIYRYNNLILMLDERAQQAESMAAVIANTEIFQKALHDKDRDVLKKNLLKNFGTIQENFGVKQFQFYLPPAILFFQVHDPDKKIENLSTFNKTVLHSYNSKAPQSGLETDIDGLEIRGVHPVFYHDEYVGTVEFGLAFDQALLNKVKKLFDMDISVYLPNTKSKLTLQRSTKTGNQIRTAPFDSIYHTNLRFHHYKDNTGSYTVLSGPLNDPSGQVIGMVELEMDRSVYIDNLKTFIKLMLLILGASIFLGVLVANETSRRVAAPIKKLTEIMTRLAKGNLDIEIEGVLRKNEIGAMANALNIFKQNAIHLKEQNHAKEVEQHLLHERNAMLEMSIEEFRASITGTLKSVEEAIKNLKKSAQYLEESSESTRIKGIEIGRSSEEAATNVNTVSAAVEELSASVNAINNQVSESRKISTEAVRQSKEAVATIKSLSEMMSKINEILDFINSIAAKTNLLALNATIEAARAGEAGKGFAVVANEVKNLASQTSQATDTINDQINNIQGRTGDVAGAINKINDIILQIEKHVTAISSSVSEQQVGTREISINTASTSQLATAVSDNIQAIQQNVDNASAQSTDVRNAAEALSLRFLDLETNVSDFLIKIKSI